VKPFELDNNCFEVKSKNDMADSLVLCGCPFEPKAKELSINWVKEILKFRDNCESNDQNYLNINKTTHLKLKYGNESVDLSSEQLKSLAKDS